MNDKITICSVGDLMIADSPLYVSVGIGSKYSGITGRLFCNCENIFHSADIVIGNFETVVYEPINSSLKEKQMCCHKDVIEELKKCGFSILNLANNHCMQHGPEGFENTRNTCVNYGIKAIGIRNELPYIVELKGCRIAFLSLCIHLEWYEPDNILYENQIDRILKYVQKLRNNDENIIIVISLHWGDEFAMYPSNAQIALGHRLIDIGANIILGHHSHVYQGIEEYRGGVIVYSQGNFISDMAPEMCRETGIINVSIEKENRSQKISYELIPFYISDEFIPILSDKDWMSERQDRLREAVSGNRTDDDYWKDIRRNHNIGHNCFKRYFKKNIIKYKFSISIKMIIDFLGRKYKRIVGTTTDGRVSSMDTTILSTLEKSL